MLRHLWPGWPSKGHPSQRFIEITWPLWLGACFGPSALCPRGLSKMLHGQLRLSTIAQSLTLMGYVSHHQAGLGSTPRPHANAKGSGLAGGADPAVCKEGRRDSWSRSIPLPHVGIRFFVLRAAWGRMQRGLTSHRPTGSKLFQEASDPGWPRVAIWVTHLLQALGPPSLWHRRVSSRSI